MHAFSLMKDKKASLHTHGCRLNQSETNIIKDSLQKAGYHIVPFGEQADLGIINTCTVTREADSKCRQSIRQFISKNPSAYTAVIGCYSQMGAKEIASIPGVDLILGNQDKLNVLNYIGKGEKNEVPVIVKDKIDKTDFTIHFVGDIPFNKRANLKIQDGCDFFCSFCRIPFARGRARSREFTNLREEALSLAERGVKEIVLTGVNIGTYGNYNKNIVDVVDALNDIPGILRVRISSIEPTTIPYDVLQRMKDSNHALMPFLHIPLQSGADSVLKSMRRKYSLQEFENFIHLAHETVPDLYLGTDIMVGYPTETLENFETTCEVFLRNPFAFCHVFTYSEREETLVAKRKDIPYIPMEERFKRSGILRRLSAKKRFDFYQKYVGKTMEVLFEDPKENTFPGYTKNYIRVVIDKKDKDFTNKNTLVYLKNQVADFIEGEPIV